MLKRLVVNLLKVIVGVVLAVFLADAFVTANPAKTTILSAVGWKWLFASLAVLGGGVFSVLYSSSLLLFFGKKKTEAELQVEKFDLFGSAVLNAIAFVIFVALSLPLLSQ